MPSLFDPVRLGALELPNRIVMAPLTRCRAGAGRVPHALNAHYYAQRASAGLIIAEATAVDPMGVGYPDTPGIWNEEQAAGWRLVTDAVHAAGGRIVLQLWHVGRISDPHYLGGALPVAPSAIAPAGKVSLLRPARPFVTPRALATEELPGVADSYRRGALLAREAGFDGVEIHGANGYLLDQFRCPALNDRNDAYGGSLANRYRLLLEVVDAVAAEVAPERIAVRQSPYGVANDMVADPEPLVTYPWLARELNRRGIGFLHIYCQSADWIHDAAHSMMPALRDAFHGALIACGGFKTPAACEAILTRGHADLIAIGKPFIANPNLVERLRRDAPLNKWDAATFYAPGEKGYTDYPPL
jgi:2,4-dienoyl-CoA reductase-like NADH-dependent reductase (Old Yellow Enzyme family)